MIYCAHCKGWCPGLAQARSPHKYWQFPSWPQPWKPGDPTVGDAEVAQRWIEQTRAGRLTHEAARESVNTEQPKERSLCMYPVTNPDREAFGGTMPCGSEDQIFKVTSRDFQTHHTWSMNVCAKHLANAWKDYQAESVEPL